MDVDKPLKEYLNPDNIESRVQGTEDALGAQPSATVESSAQLSSFTGTQIVGNLISPAVGVEATDVTSTDFTGSFVSGEGATFNSTAYHMGGVNAGVLQWGAKQDDGALLGGGGTVEIDIDGIAIITGPSASEGDKLKFREYSTGNMNHASFSVTTATTDTSYFEASVGSTDNAFSRYRTKVDSAYGTAEIKMQSDSDSVVTDIGLNGAVGILRVDHLTNTVSVNSASSSTDALQVQGNAIIRGGFLGVGVSTTLTVASGAVTATQSHHVIDTEGGAATDNLDTINGGQSGDFLFLRSANNGRDTTLTDGVGNLILAGAMVLDNTADMIMLMKIGSNWVEVSRSNNA